MQKGKNMKSNILITGGLGRIGQKLVKQLAVLGHNIHIISTTIGDSNTLITSKKIKIYKTDFLNFTQMKRIIEKQNIDTVIHLADKPIPSEVEVDPFSGIKEYIFGTVKLFTLCQELKVKKFIFPSSGGTVYGQAKHFPIKEDDRTQPLSYYGCMKLSIEQYLYAAEKYGKTDLVIFRISNAYGLHFIGISQGVIDVFIHLLSEGKNITVWGSGEIIRDYIYIDDISNAFTLAIQKPISGIFNIGSGVGHSINEILKELSKYFNLKNRVIFKSQRAFDTEKNVLDITKAHKIFRWTPVVSLEKGIEKIING